MSSAALEQQYQLIQVLATWTAFLLLLLLHLKAVLGMVRRQNAALFPARRENEARSRREPSAAL